MGLRSTVLTAIALPLTAAIGGCAMRPPPPGPQDQIGSILVSSIPTAGSTVRAPVDALELQFNPTARLDEVNVAGPDGVMPMMVHAVGEAADYSLPLSGLGPGAYSVDWRAEARGREYRGHFRFTVK